MTHRAELRLRTHGCRVLGMVGEPEPEVGGDVRRSRRVFRLPAIGPACSDPSAFR
jgi:hypothetical protein